VGHHCIDAAEVSLGVAHCHDVLILKPFVVFAARDEKRGSGTVGKSLYHPKTLVDNGIMEQECSNLLLSFFENLRK
jgi:hypothetical protein